MPRGTSGAENANSNYSGQQDRAARRERLIKQARSAQAAGRGTRRV